MHASSVLNSQVLRLNLEYFALHLSWRCEFFKLFHHQCHGTPVKELKVPYRTAELPINGGKKCKLATLPCCRVPPLLSYHTLWLTLYVKKLSYFLPTVGAFDRPFTNFWKKSGARVWSKAKKHGGKLWNGVCQPLEDGERPTAKAIGKIGVFNLWSWIKFHFEKFVKL